MPPPLLAFGLTVALCPAVLWGLRRLNVVDIPGERSSHLHPTPRGGGLAPALGVIIAAALSSSIGGSRWLGLLAAGFAFGVMGLIEDMVGVPALRRLIMQVVVAIVALPWLLSSLDGAPILIVVFGTGSALWLVGYVNAFNFMDGINGISAVQVVVAGLTLYSIGRLEDMPILATGAAIVMAAALGFAPFNFPRALMFLGDVGSYFFGAWLGALALLAVEQGIAPESVLAPFALYVADTGTTLIRRIRRRARWYAPHRDHTYQQLVGLGWSHVKTTSAVGVLLVLSSCLGALALTQSLLARLVGDFLLVALLVGYLLTPRFFSGREDKIAPALA